MRSELTEQEQDLRCLAGYKDAFVLRLRGGPMPVMRSCYHCQDATNRHARVMSLNDAALRFVRFSEKAGCTFLSGRFYLEDANGWTEVECVTAGEFARFVEEARLTWAKMEPKLKGTDR